MNVGGEPGLNVLGRVRGTALACIALLGPILTGLAVCFLAPHVMERFGAAYTSLEWNALQLAHNAGEALPAGDKAFYRWVYAYYMAIETGIRLWHGIRPGLILAGCWSVLAALLWWAGASAKGRRRWVLYLVFQVGALLAALPFRPWALALPASAVAALVFALTLLRPSSRSTGRTVTVWLLSFTGAPHLLAPVILLENLADWAAPGSQRGRVVARVVGRAWICGISFVVIGVVSLSMRNMPVSPEASLLLEGENLYHVVIDRTGGRVLISNKSSGYRQPAYALDLNEPDASPQPFSIPSAEAEIIALDEAGRKLYHVDRGMKRLLVMNADSLAVEKYLNFPADHPGRGSTYPLLAKDAGVLLIQWEENLLATVNLTTWDYLQKDISENGEPVYDPTHGRLYLQRGGPNPDLLVINPRSLAIEKTVPAPRLTYRMALQGTNLLYAADAWGGKIWVYSRPDLTLLRKLPASFGVTILAIDEQRGWLLAANAVSGIFRVIDTRTGECLRRSYIGPYCKGLAVDSEQRRAFLTLRKKGVYAWDY